MPIAVSRAFVAASRVLRLSLAAAMSRLGPVVIGLMLALAACSTRAIDVICPPAGQCPDARAAHGGGY